MFGKTEPDTPPATSPTTFKRVANQGGRSEIQKEACRY